MVRTTSILCLSLLLLACSGADKLTADDVVGYWTGDWGRMVLRAVGGEIWGAYDHDEGTAIGTLDGNGVMRGWWCEAPSRAVDYDAGEFEFTFSRSGDLSLDGRWRYGVDGEWKEDWDLVHVTDLPPPELEERFEDQGAFCPHP
ncbi:MAG: hypothetical protein HYY06_01155 [Deltaproteobacteria bacterium]|nr:hypothetical protein [Deltaproteobacteria bacterium]